MGKLAYSITQDDLRYRVRVTDNATGREVASVTMPRRLADAGGNPVSFIAAEVATVLKELLV